MRLISLGCSALAAVVALSCVRAEAEDLVIYGGTSAGVSAALQAKRMGLSAVLLEPTGRIGGLTTGGLGQTDIGTKESFGGIAREFYAAVRKWYDDPAHWTRQTFEDYLPDGQCAETKQADTMWTFEPSAALAILEGWERDNGLRVVRHVRLDRGKGGVTVADGRIVSIRTEDGRVWAAKMFIDATYEGDLMAAAGVSYAFGREGNAVYGETVDGIERRHSVSHQFFPGVDAYVKPGDRSSGLLPGVEEEDPRADGEGDSRIQAYCFRMCLTDVPENRIPFRKPEGYRELDYELLLRNLERGVTQGTPWINSRMPNRKTDTNNRGGVSTDFIGMNHAYPEASYAEREEIEKAHLRYQQGLMWTLANHPRVPARIRDEVARWGTCRDEFVGERGDGWQNQLYVREARRLVGEYVMTEHECMGARTAPNPVALAAYGMDSHNCRRYVGADGCVRNEGDVQHWTLPDGRRIRPYAIGYGALVPKRSECANLLVPVCVSASHIAFGSIRMEPVFFALGQVAGTAAAQAIAAGCAVQDVDYAALRARLLADGQVVDPPPDPAKAEPCRIEGPPAPKPWEMTAVKEFTDYFLRVSAGGKVFVDGEGVVVFHVGDTEFARKRGLLSSSFADEEWCVRSFGHDVVLNGGGTRGCLYAVYNFLEKRCWIRWWNDGDEQVPSGKALEFSALDMRGRPFFRYRNVYRAPLNGNPPDFRTAVRNRLNANCAWRIPLAWGGGVEFGLPAFVHAWDRYLPFEKYGAAHPEWYSLRGGKRVGGMREGQLCLSNRELVPELARRVEEAIAETLAKTRANGAADPSVYDLSMNDNRNFCECDACRAEVGKYGHSGQQIRFVNAIAAEVGRRHPELKFTMAAYLYAEDPPKGGVRAAPNVIVRLANTRSNLAAPVTDPSNAYLAELPGRWRGVADEIWMWDYGITFGKDTLGWPFPSERHYGGKFRLYADSGITGVLFEHEHPEAADMYELKLFMEAHLMEDPHADAAFMSDEFMYQFYGGKPYPLIKDIRLRLETERKAKGGRVTWFPGRGEFDWLDSATLDELDRLLDEALRAPVLDNEDLRRRRMREIRRGFDRVREGRRVSPADVNVNEPNRK